MNWDPHPPSAREFIDVSREGFERGEELGDPLKTEA